jgi:nicotinamide mononucleotide (NMN) deamidase PncC
MRTEGIRLRSRSDIGLSTTGIAGPGGGTADKPVGLVYIACADGRGTGIEKHLFARDRWWHKERAACAVLDMARRRLLESP